MLASRVSALGASLRAERTSSRAHERLGRRSAPNAAVATDAAIATDGPTDAALATGEPAARVARAVPGRKGQNSRFGSGKLVAGAQAAQREVEFFARDAQP
jgi:hypothetical protein